MKTAIVTDANSGISSAAAEKLGIYVIPMPVIIDGEVFYEGINLTEESIFQALTSGRSISTSQPSPGDVMDLWDSVFRDGYEEIVYIPMSSGLSKSCEMALALARDYEGKVFVADNHRVSVTMLEAVYQAQQLANSGLSGREIHAILEKEAYQCTIYIAVNTLDYLKKGGRVTPAAAMLGTFLSIKPILSIQGEKLDSFAKVRGNMRKCEARMIEALKDDFAHRFSDQHPSRMHIGAAGACLSDEEKLQWVNALKEAFPMADVYYSALSASICCHTGPGAVGVGMSFR